MKRDQMIKELWDLLANTSNDLQEIEEYGQYLHTLTKKELEFEYKEYILGG